MRYIRNSLPQTLSDPRHAIDVGKCGCWAMSQKRSSLLKAGNGESAASGRHRAREVAKTLGIGRRAFIGHWKRVE